MRQPRRVSRHLARQRIRHPPYRALSSSRTRQGSLLVPHDTSRHDLVPATPSSLPGRRGVPPAPWRPSWPSVVRLPPARYRECGVTVPCDASSTAYTLLRCSTALAQLSSLLSHAELFVPATSPVATDVCGAPYHRIITRAPKILLARPLARLARRPILGPVTTGSPHRATGCGRQLRPLRAARVVVTGRCASDRAPDENHHRAHHRLVGAGHLDVGPARIRRSQDTLAALDGHQPHPRRAAGIVRQ